MQHFLMQLDAVKVFAGGFAFCASRLDTPTFNLDFRKLVAVVVTYSLSPWSWLCNFLQ